MPALFRLLFPFSALSLAWLPAPLPAQTPAPGASLACSRLTHAGTDYRNSATAGQNYAGQDLSDANFSGTDLTGTTFENADLTGADLTGATLGYANGTATNFTSADLTDACLQGVMITGADSNPGADFQFATLDCTAITDTDISQAAFGPSITLHVPDMTCRTSFANTVMTCEFLPQWAQLDLGFADISACKDDLAGRDLTGAMMPGVQFGFYDLTGTVFTDAGLAGANFYSATLSKAVLQGADLQYATLSSVSADSADFSAQARLSGATMSFGDFSNASFNTAILESSDGVPAAAMSFGNFRGADFTQAAMVGVNLSGAALYDGTIMNSATIENANLTNANLWELQLPSAGLSGITFDYANLINANLSGATLNATSSYRATSLAKANLQGVDLSQAILGGVNMANAAVALDDGVPLFVLTQDVAGLTSDLNDKWLTAEIYQAFGQSGYAIAYCSSPQVTVLGSNAQWLIQLHQRNGVGPKGGTAYKVFLIEADNDGVAVSGMADETPTALFDVAGDFAAALNGQTIPRALMQGFESNDYTLPPCDGPKITPNRTRGYWDLSSLLTDTAVPVVGYTGFRIFDTGDDTLAVYGTNVTSIYQDDQGRLAFTATPVEPTNFYNASFSDSTVMPNGNTYGANQAAGLALSDMMIAPAPPAPPTCAPGSLGC
ncbi:pentapeptide repeat-containing protein [Thalassococcus sp. BH17M4-6]|uniref:pentapeptide repeat-containing protein n=1 Tax=Thalassococcus sp. BH17M4-6 TaxID=3413148 RepID=UPI003BBD49C8